MRPFIVVCTSAVGDNQTPSRFTAAAEQAVRTGDPTDNVITKATPRPIYTARPYSERDFPDVRTQARLDFAWFVVEKQLTDFYSEVLQVLQEFRDESGLKLPAIEYRYSAIQTLLANDTARSDSARIRQAGVSGSRENSFGMAVSSSCRACRL